MEGSSRTKVTPKQDALHKTEASLHMKVQEVPRAQPPMISPVISQAPPLMLPCHPPTSTSCHHFWMVAREKKKKYDTHLPLKGMAQKLHTSLLLMSHWPELNHMTMLTTREAGKCSLQLDGSSTFGVLLLRKEWRVDPGGQ